MPLPELQAQALFESFQHCTKKKKAEALACIESFLDRGITLKEIIDKGGNTVDGVDNGKGFGESTGWMPGWMLLSFSTV